MYGIGQNRFQMFFSKQVIAEKDQSDSGSSSDSELGMFDTYKLNYNKWWRGERLVEGCALIFG